MDITLYERNLFAHTVYYPIIYYYATLNYENPDFKWYFW